MAAAGVAEMAAYVSSSGAEYYDWLGEPAGAAAVWGLTTRLLAVVQIISMGALTWQISMLAGSKGLTPCIPALRAAWRDFGIKALWYQPTIMWLGVAVPAIADLLLVLLPVAGSLASLATIVGGPWSRWSFIASWAIMLSIDAGPVAYMFPWDSCLLEASFLAIFLPPTRSILPLLTGSGGGGAFADAIATSALPSPLVAFLVRYLLARLMLGFGKIKFMGSTKQDRLYIKSFFITQPIPAPLALLAYQLAPRVFFVFSLAVMAVVELALPPIIFLPGWPRIIAGVGFIALMAGIQATGNYGYFNVLYIALSVPLFAHAGTVFSLDIARDVLSLNDPWITLLAALSALVILPGSLFYFAFNSWINLSWTYWPTLHRMKPTWLFRHVVTYFRFWAPLRLVQAYGVFPPNSAPPQRWLVTYEATDDGGRTWHPLPAPYVALALTHVAPYHPRLTHNLFYESGGMNGSNFMGILSHPGPYGWTPASGWARMQIKLARALAFGWEATDGSVIKPRLDEDKLPPLRVGTWARLHAPGKDGKDGKDDAQVTPLPVDLSRSSPPDAASLPTALARDGWTRIGTTPMVRARLLNAVPKTFGEFVADAMAIIRTGKIPGAQEVVAHGGGGAVSLSMPTIAGASPTLETSVPPHNDGTHPALADRATLPGSLGLLDKIRAAAFHWKSTGTHFAPMAAVHVYERKGTGIAYIPDDYSAALEHQVASAGPEDFWWESAHARRRASTTAGVITPAEYDEAWRFIDVVRKAALKAAAEAPAAAVSGAPFGAGAAAGTTTKTGPVSVGAILACTQRLLPLATGTGGNSTGKAAGAGTNDSLPLHASNEAFVWRNLPGTMERVFATYSDTELLRIRATINRMTLPVLRACERVFWRAPPTAAELEKEAAAVGLLPAPASDSAAAAVAPEPDSAGGVRRRKASPSGAARTAGTPGGKASPVETAAFDQHALFLQLGEMIEGTPVMPGAGETVTVAGVEHPVAAFAGNDDAAVTGAMRNHVRFGMYAQWLMLVGGKAAYEGVLGGDATTSLLNKRLPTHTNAPDFIGKAPVAQLFAALNPSADVNVSQMATEAGTFLLAATNYDMFARVVANTRMMAMTARPKADKLAPLPALLPGFLGFIPRLAVHSHIVTAWDHVHGRFIEPLAIPDWAFDTEGVWSLLKH